jgi:uncharacterized membrane-anchored protein YhcB (DUF1043 family)
MFWLTGIVCLAAGLVAGLLIAKRISGSSPAKVAELEARVQELQRHHVQYRENVSQHFSTTAELVQHMTESYRDVYQHLAGGAQDLCTEDVAGKLLPAADQSVFYYADDDSLEPPKDYAPKKAPGQSGALAENFGLDADNDTLKDQSWDNSQDKSKGQGRETIPDKHQEQSPSKDKSAGKSPDNGQDKSTGDTPDKSRQTANED